MNIYLNTYTVCIYIYMYIYILSIYIYIYIYIISYHTISYIYIYIYHHHLVHRVEAGALADERPDLPSVLWVALLV